MKIDEGTPLHEFDKEEWWDVMRRAKPEITRVQFEEAWAEFCALKETHQRKQQLQ